MHMTTKNSVTSGKPQEYSIWSSCFFVVSAFTLDEVLAGGLIRESLNLHKLEYALSVFSMIATAKVLASDGTKGVCYNRAYSRQAL
jgi:hypothetical protein